MQIEEIKKIIGESLKKMGCVDIIFVDSNDNSLSVVFNCKEITSFVTNIPNWTHSGIYLDPTNTHQYKIDFKK